MLLITVESLPVIPGANISFEDVRPLELFHPSVYLFNRCRVTSPYRPGTVLNTRHTMLNKTLSWLEKKIEVILGDTQENRQLITCLTRTVLAKVPCSLASANVQLQPTYDAKYTVHDGTRVKVLPRCKDADVKMQMWISSLFLGHFTLATKIQHGVIWSMVFTYSKYFLNSQR